MRMGVINTPGEVTPLIFQSASRRTASTEPETLFNPARAQEEADLVDGLRGQIKALQAKVELVRGESHAEGRAEASASFAAGLEQERAAIAEACNRFAADRERYFTEVEGEVVRLALAIAARVLHREAKMDPLLLAASVRVALEKIADQPGTILRVPAHSAPAWNTFLAGNSTVEVIASEDLAPGDLLLESPVGRVELGIPVQLEEIEKGFFDLLQKRPS
jgi:flagellar assembly protein FliH